jgi:hypothetical protein
LADKSTRLIHDALARAAAEPEGYPLLAGKSESGLFPSTALARAAAERAKANGLLEVVRAEVRGKLTREICMITEKGRDYLTRRADPREVLEDFVRVLESRQTDMRDLSNAACQMRQSLQGIQAVVTELLPRLTQSNGHPAPADSLTADLKARLAEWHASAGASEDCPLPELYRRLEASVAPTIGQFHDCLRQLHDEQMIYLHPWTGPLYAMPDPAFALLIGHEVAYYASIR